MAVASDLKTGIKAHPVAITAVVTVVGYAVVLNAFSQYVSILPDISEDTVRLLSSLIVVINAATLTALAAGVYFIRNRRIARHRLSMLTAVVLELVFLLVYVWKVGGGGELQILATGTVKLVYLLVLGVHLVCSALAVPLVVYALTLGLTRTPAELTGSNHPRVGKVAVLVWGTSLVLGIVTHVMLTLAGSELHPIGMVLV